jgi:uncharacterized membrane protein
VVTGTRHVAGDGGLGVYFTIAGLVIAALGVPLWRRKVGPNRLYGVRTAKTMRDEALWYAANARAGRTMVAVGVVTSATSASLAGLGVVGDTHALSMAVVLAVGAALVAFVGLREGRGREGDARFRRAGSR